MITVTCGIKHQALSTNVIADLFFSLYTLCYINKHQLRQHVQKVENQQFSHGLVVNAKGLMLHNVFNAGHKSIRKYGKC